MTLRPPKPNIEPAPGEKLDEARLRELARDIQQALDFIYAHLK